MRGPVSPEIYYQNITKMQQRQLIIRNYATMNKREMMSSRSKNDESRRTAKENS